METTCQTRVWRLSCQLEWHWSNSIGLHSGLVCGCQVLLDMSLATFGFDSTRVEMLNSYVVVTMFVEALN